MGFNTGWAGYLLLNSVCQWRKWSWGNMIQMLYGRTLWEKNSQFFDVCGETPYRFLIVVGKPHISLAPFLTHHNCENLYFPFNNWHKWVLQYAYLWCPGRASNGSRVIDYTRYQLCLSSFRWMLNEKWKRLKKKKNVLQGTD